MGLGRAMTQNERNKRIRHWFGDILRLESNRQTKELWNRLDQEARKKKNAEKKAQAKADIARRQSKTPSRKYVGKHDRQDGGVSRQNG